MILPTDRDRRLISERRGGTLTDDNHHLLAEWAALCAEHVLEHFERVRPDAPAPREAIGLVRAWIRGEVRTGDARRGSFAANAAGRGLPDPARFAALAAGQAAAVPHVAAHDLGAAAYGIKAAMAAAVPDEAESARLGELEWQRGQLPEEVRELVIDDQRQRNDICWNVFWD